MIRAICWHWSYWLSPVPMIPKTMRAVVYRGPNTLRLETVPVPRIGPGELLVRVAVCGVCPTDIKKIQYGTVPPPRIFGHETAGTIVRVGARVRGFKVGERVALHHHVPCLECHACRHRAFAQCAQYKRTGITAGFEPAGGGYAEYVRVMPFVLPGVVKIPARNTFLEGAMLEPVNTVLKAVKRLALLRGDTVLVAGQGPIGLDVHPPAGLAGNAGDRHRPAADAAGAGPGVRSRCCASPESEPSPESKGRIAHASRSRTRSLHVPSHPSSTSTITEGRGLDAAVIAVPSDAVVREAQALVRGGGQVLLFSHTRRGTKRRLTWPPYVWTRRT